VWIILWCREEHKFFTIPILTWNILNILASQIETKYIFSIVGILTTFNLLNKEFGQDNFCQQKLAIQSANSLHETR
jgi:hypothetical protein